MLSSPTATKLAEPGIVSMQRSSVAQQCAKVISRTAETFKHADRGFVHEQGLPVLDSAQPWYVDRYTICIHGNSEDDSLEID